MSASLSSKFNYNGLVETFRREFPDEQENIFFLTTQYKTLEDAFDDFLTKAATPQTRQALQDIRHKRGHEMQNSRDRGLPFVITEKDDGDFLEGTIKIVSPEILTPKRIIFLPYVMAEALHLDLRKIHPYAKTSLISHEPCQFFDFHHEAGHGLSYGLPVLTRDPSKDSEEEGRYRYHVSECIGETYGAIRYIQSDKYDPQFMSWRVLRRGLNQLYRPKLGYVFLDCFNELSSSHTKKDLEQLSPRESLILAIDIATRNALPYDGLHDLSFAFHNASVWMGRAGEETSYERYAHALGMVAYYCTDAIKKENPTLTRHAGFVLQLLGETLPENVRFQARVRDGLNIYQEKTQGAPVVRPFAI